MTFGGAQSVSVKKGAVTYSDVVDLTGGIKAGDMVSVSAYLKGGQSGTSVTGHPGARTSSWREFRFPNFLSFSRLIIR